MEENMAEDASTSRRNIKDAVEDQLHDKFSVMCATGEFSYTAYTESFCRWLLTIRFRIVEELYDGYTCKLPLSLEILSNDCVSTVNAM
ncbi:unnamed protein product [Enterobius vermicularis]|uniref:Ground-like domain-containing protein n=1 Tax=Enterobius vermicularis TaxID=51028 RepID=A0A0N4VHA3_ENTVE|nr:unnamed protein product [Enterobius vermicularis]